MPTPESALEFLRRQADLVRRLSTRKRIVFPEGSDPRIIGAAERLVSEGLLDPILIGPRPAGAAAGITFVQPEQSPKLEAYAQLFYERRRSRGVTPMEAREVARRPLHFAALMVSAGDADGFVGGAANSTAETVRAALACIGTPPTVRTVSSIMMLCLHNRSVGHQGIFACADTAIVPQPTSLQLAEIAIATAQNARVLLDCEPVVALLSFSTKGSAKHKEADRVIEALRIVRARVPDLHIDGELQADAAVSLAVGRSKAPGSTVAGNANTLVFPDLNAANIGYKLAERLCDGLAIGPFLQGLAKPANDLSRGASVQEIYGCALVTAVQSEQACRNGHC